MNKLPIDAVAPDFSIVGTDLQAITKEQFAGKNLVILFFPLAFTSVCTTELCMARDDMNQYDELDSEVIGISVDSPFVLKKLAEENELKFPLGSDFNRTMSIDYDTLFTDMFAGMTGFSKRSVFILDKHGVLRYNEMVASGQLPDFDKIKSVLTLLN